MDEREEEEEEEEEERLLLLCWSFSSSSFCSIDTKSLAPYTQEGGSCCICLSRLAGTVCEISMYTLLLSI